MSEYDNQYYQKNKERILENQRRYIARNKEAVLERSRKGWRTWRQNNPDKVRNKKLMEDFGITLEEYNAMFEDQGGCCAICGTHQDELPKNLSVDHDHETGEVRGLLCGHCNLTIGHARESPEILASAIEYLRRYGK
jgi:hypothetical protein